ncbi:MAG TPA: HutD family protein [Oligoflexus sp.]|uniref:HutD/Ves family protein n=1 Tax=Oligoflexus sp. TaxID=1971216 RepID=UPI002D80FB78|nr:HutD family protein [Oligoflexus sp.]HET9241207.1 HutD family protein [Oligoflexus sp.]
MSDQVTHLTPSAYKFMPWKNGAGSTTELFIAPPGATVQSGFDWRISLAQVPASGPFSVFSDYQRTIVLLNGDPMHLLHEGRGRHELQALEPYEFHGGWPTEGVLTGRAVEDFNVMVRDGFGQVRVHVQKASEKLSFSAQYDDLCFIYCHAGSFTVSLQNEKKRITEHEALFTEHGRNALLHAESPTSVALIVSITRDRILSKGNP